jgi:hypothetical protein
VNKKALVGAGVRPARGRRLLVGIVAAALLVPLWGSGAVAGGAAGGTVVNVRKVGASFIMSASEPRTHGVPGRRTAHARADFDGDGVDDLAVAGAQVEFLSDMSPWPEGVVAVRYSRVQRDDLFFGASELGQGGGFGSVLATGDFNDDGRDDLVVAEPFDSANGSRGAVGAGVVWILPGSRSGLDIRTAYRISRGTSGVVGDVTPDELFGDQLAVGDLDHDGRDDLAIAAPGTKVGSTQRAGAVVVLYGSRYGISGAGSQVVSRSTPGVPGGPRTDERFGYRLAIGRVTGDAYADLIIGVPMAVTTGTSHDGAVVMVPGGSRGVSGASASAVTGDAVSWALSGSGHYPSVFMLGESIVTADLNGDGRDEVVAASPGGRFLEQMGGLVVALKASGSRLVAGGATAVSQSSPGMPGEVDQRGAFGASLAAADLDRDGRDDLAIGAPFRDVGSVTDAGSVFVVRGSSAGLTSRGAKLYTQGSPGMPGTPARSVQFGHSVAFLDLDGSNRADLVVGTPGDESRNYTTSGSVTALRNVWGVLEPDVRWVSAAAGIPGLTGGIRGFGWAVAGGSQR